MAGTHPFVTFTFTRIAPPVPLPGGKGDIPDPFAWQDAPNGQVPPLEFTNPPPHPNVVG